MLIYSKGDLVRSPLLKEVPPEKTTERAIGTGFLYSELRTQPIHPVETVWEKEGEGGSTQAMASQQHLSRPHVGTLKARWCRQTQRLQCICTEW